MSLPPHEVRDRSVAAIMQENTDNGTRYNPLWHTGVLVLTRSRLPGECYDRKK